MKTNLTFHQHHETLIDVIVESNATTNDDQLNVVRQYIQTVWPSVPPKSRQYRQLWARLLDLVDAP